MFGKKSDNGYTEVLPGIKIKTLCYGDQTLMTEFMLTKDALLPEHSHENEQIGYLVSGQIKLFINDAARVINPGDSWNVPSNVKHRAEILENAVALEVFCPCRNDYLQYVFKPDIE